LNDDAFGIDDLTGNGPRAEETRQLLALGLESGEMDPAVCPQLAGIAAGAGRPGLGLWFLAEGLANGLASLPEAVDETAELLARIALAIGANDEARVAGVAGKVFSAIDASEGGSDSAVLSALSLAGALESRAMKSFVDWAEGDAGLGASQTFVTLKMMLALFRGDLSAARAEAERLLAMPATGEWTLRALAKLAMIEGDLGAAVDLFRRALDLHGERRQVLVELATALYCRGGKNAAQSVLSRSFEQTPREVLEERQNQIAQWNAQLEEAIERDIVDGGAMGRLGAAVHYTAPERVEEFWNVHRLDCVSDKAYSNISAYTNQQMFTRVEGLLEQRPEIRKVINYGTLAGVLEDRLAAVHPDRVWAGYDISDLATEWNREGYNRPNLMFSSDLEGLLRELGDIPGETIMVHCRTMDVMLPAAVRRVYRACHAHGVDLILSAEYFSFSLPTLQFPDFENDPTPSHIMDGIVMTHNYARIMPETGYRIVSSQYGPVPLMISANGEGMFGEQMIHYVLAERIGE